MQNILVIFLLLWCMMEFEMINYLGTCMHSAFLY